MVRETDTLAERSTANESRHQTYNHLCKIIMVQDQFTFNKIH